MENWRRVIIVVPLGTRTMYEYIASERWEMFPSRKDILSGIAVMEKLSY
ncbi:MAG: hypothetical protein KAR21_11845 [Spirochaetales bacterium]|nr:hypothetical protein [Spirochaetales bacterium]